MISEHSLGSTSDFIKAELSQDARSVYPNFVIYEMSKWKVKSPIIILDERSLGVIPKKLDVIAVLKRKQLDPRKIKKYITKHI